MIKKLSMIFILFFLCACDKTTQEENDSVELTVWECYKYEEHELFLDFVSRFCKKYKQKNGKNLKIHVKRVPFDDFVTNIKLMALRGKTPDLGCFDSLKVLEFAYHKILVPLNKLPNFEEKSIAQKRESYISGAYNTNVIRVRGEENLYGLPLQITCLGLFWNRKLFREKREELTAAGLDYQAPPRDWDNFVRYAKILTDSTKNQYGFAMKNSMWFTIPFFAAYNTKYLRWDQEQQNCILGDEKSTAALQLKADLYAKYKIAAATWAGQDDPDIGFQNEQYAMIFMGPWNVSKYRNSGLDFGISLMPRLSRQQAIAAKIIKENTSQQKYLETVTPATNIGGQNIAMFKTCKNKEIAYEFMNFITSTDVQLEWCQKLNQLSINKKTAQILRNNTNTDYDIRIFMEQALYSNAPPKLPRYGYLEADILNPEMELVFKGAKSAKQALQDAAKKINERIIKPFQNPKDKD
ncbi:extracellular solute-binding protein [Candidatus Uabimicrobium sp. HlEnr_7]|uniref:extracellular solute-binding protein n=1 Tax=Candidatus Uabimicrobium helgolandensis TaxID=3095367 RepID=UPI003556BE3A